MENKTIPQLKEYLRNNGVKGYSNLNKNDLVNLIKKNNLMVRRELLMNNKNNYTGGDIIN